MTDNNPAKLQCMNMIMQHLASTNNFGLLSSIYSHRPSFMDTIPNVENDNFEPKTNNLLNINILKSIILSTSYNELYDRTLEESNIFIRFHRLYPDELNDEEYINNLDENSEKELMEWVATLFQQEIELKVQIILSTQYWKENYVQHKKLNDMLLHPNRYNFDGSDINARNEYIPQQEVIQFISHCANGLIYIRRIHQQLDYLGQQCTKPGINLDNLNDATITKIHQFLNKHTFQNFISKVIETMEIAQSRVCNKGKDFLTRLLRANIQKIISGDYTRSPSPFKSREQQQIITSKFALRTVVDVKINDIWCAGTIIKRFEDENGRLISLKIALHQENMDSDGKYQYDTHLRIKNLKDVIHCINEDGEYEIDDNDKLIIDPSPNISSSQFSSPIKQEEIRKQKQLQQLRLSQQQQSQIQKARQRKPNRTIPPFFKQTSPQRTPQRTSNTTQFAAVLAQRNRNKKQQQSVIRNLGSQLSNIDINDEEEEEEEEEEEDEDDINMDPKIRKALNTHTVPSQSSQITEPNLSNELSPNTMNRARIERTQQFRVSSDQTMGNHNHNNNNNKPSRRSPPRRRKRSREEFEKKQEEKEDIHSKTKNPPKRRKIVTRSTSKASQKEKEKEKETKQRRQSKRLLERRNSLIMEQEKEKEKKKKNKRQTTIGSTKDGNITYHDPKNKRKDKKNKKDKNNNSNNSNNRNNGKQDDGSSEGEEIEWSDDMSEDMAKLAKQKSMNAQKVNTRKGEKKKKWTKEAEDALKASYAKHDKIRKTKHRYAIWDHIKRDDEYCKFWPDRSAVSIRDKARSLLGLDNKKKKK